MKTLIIGTVWPEPNSSAAGTRMLQLILCLQAAGHDICFACAAVRSEFSTDLATLGVRCETIKLNDSGFDQFVGAFLPTVVIFDRFMIEEQFGWRVNLAAPKAVRILDTEDLHFLRKARHTAVKQTGQAKDAILETEEAKRELAAILRSDLSLIVSDFEYDLLVTRFKIDPTTLLYLPIWMESQLDKQRLKEFGERSHFVSIGNFLHAPNRDAVQQLKEKIWPLIRAKLPKAEMHIYGAYTDQKALQLHNEKGGFLIKGRAENAQTVVANARVLLAPLRFGAGIKGKFLEAMALGTPSATTAIGAEGMAQEGLWGGTIAESPEEFAASAVALYQDEASWKLAQSRGFSLLKKRFGAARWQTVLPRKIAELAQNLDGHRKHNFIGQILRHQTLRSTEYMSRWIEAKNNREKN